MQLALSDLNLIYACTMDKTVMIETQAREISNNDLKVAFKLAHSEVRQTLAWNNSPYASEQGESNFLLLILYFLQQAIKLIPPQIQLASKVENKKRSVATITLDKDVLANIRSKAEVAINSVMGNSSYGKVGIIMKACTFNTELSIFTDRY